MNIWRLMMHHTNPDKALDWTRQSKRIAIGWGEVGDIRMKGYTSPQEISGVIGQLYREGKHPYNNAGQGGACLWNFYFAMQKDDLVILNTKHGPSLVVQVQGDYEWKSEEKAIPNYLHQRIVTITDRNPREVWHRAGAGPILGHSIRWTLIQCERALPK